LTIKSQRKPHDNDSESLESILESLESILESFVPTIPPASVEKAWALRFLRFRIVEKAHALRFLTIYSLRKHDRSDS
jgi:hypothetical protein